MASNMFDVGKPGLQPTAMERQSLPTGENQLEAGPMQTLRSDLTNHDATVPDPFAEVADEIFNRFSAHRKRIITFILGVCGFLSPMSSTAILSAVPEVAETFGTSGSTINISNAVYLAFMGISPIFFGPISTMVGRKWPCQVNAVLFTLWSIGSALAPNLESYFIFRMLTAFQGTSFLMMGSAVIGDIYKPVERATALSYFLCGTLIAPALGPFIGGVIVTYRSWRVIFWLQSALSGAATILVILGLPETIHRKGISDLAGLENRAAKIKQVWQWTNPLRVIFLFRVPNLIVMAIATSSLVWTMYSLITPIRYVLNPRFNLTTPLQSGFFFLAPGLGYVVGTLLGGRWSDRTVKKWIRVRGARIPEDRLRSAIPFIGFVVPGSMLVYGWSVEKQKGGIFLPVIAMFIQGVAQLFCFPAFNAYCIEVIPERSAEVIGGNYVARYLFGAFGTAVVLPAIESIGVGWFSTISAGFLIVAATLVYLTALYGKEWRERAYSAHHGNEKTAL